MLLTGKIIERILKERAIIDKWPELRSFREDVLKSPKKGCGSCSSIPEHMKHKLYLLLAQDRKLLDDFKTYYNTKVIELYFSIDGKRKELYYLK